MENVNNFTIVGGGTAGWMTALYVKKLFPNSIINVVESPEIDIIGAGEGSTVSMVTFIQDLGISLKDLLNNTDGTIKLGIKFSNWNGDGKFYYHPFGPYLGKYPYNLSQFNLSNGKMRSTTINDEGRFFLSLACVNNVDLTNNILNNVLCEKRNVSILNDNTITSLHSIHFDSYKLGTYLKKIAINRGVNYISDEVIEIIQDSDNNIKTLLCKKSQINSDFFFDCSGFKRLLTNEVNKDEWIDFSQHLPVNTALPFHLPPKETIDTYTTSTAMKSGWLWEIPLQTRIGAGYIYNDNYIDEDGVVEEINQMFNFKPQIIKKIKFKSGRLKNVWSKNCISIGLSSGFTEPLEATSIMMITSQLTLLNLHIGGIINNNDLIKKQYNEIVGNISDHVMEFLSFHYITKRRDSKFWRDLNEKNFIPKNIKRYMEIWKDQIPTNIDNHSYWDMFTSDNYLMVGNGLGIFDDYKDNWVKQFKSMGVKNNKEYWVGVGELLNRISNNCPKHEDFIKNSYNG